ncbi:23S rRNA (uracil(1939)-C(5))-methyltransferase RlmD [Eggerthellaceae bacterium 24-137]
MASGRAKRCPSAAPKTACALCPVFGRCGGCSQLDVPYESQLAAKQQVVADLFTDLAPDAAMLPILGMEEPFHYRNKVISPYAPAKGARRSAAAKGGAKGKGAGAKLSRADILTGMYEAGSHRLIPTDACAIENETAKQVTLAVRDIMARWGMEPYDEDAGCGFVRHVVVRVGHESGEVLVTVVTNGDEFPASKAFCRELKRRVPAVTTIVQNVNTRQTNVILGEKERVLFGPGFILDTLCGLSFRISSQSFYQVNATQTEVLYNEAIRLANLTGTETVIDAYCGTGTIGLVAAKHGAARVIGVDSVASAIRDAAGNARHNGVENASFVAEDATAFMRDMAAEAGRPYRVSCPTSEGGTAHPVGASHEAPLVLLMDPPRAGSTPEFLRAACALAPERIVYISCNPHTQARDVRQLVGEGYEVRAIRPVDMFPHTDHVESIVMLEKTPALATMAERRGGVGCSGRASSAATGSAQCALPQSEDCLSESEHPASPTEGMPQQKDRK